MDGADELGSVAEAKAYADRRAALPVRNLCFDGDLVYDDAGAAKGLARIGVAFAAG
ncbi:MAG TPA: hypothetical protein VGU26_01705 [Gaiellaceae bacterium]|nr:hypothetical protein [Gaiellaceae bacterium]